MRDWERRVAAGVLLTPAVVALLVAYVIPALRILANSLRDQRLAAGPGQPFGLFDNFANVGSDLLPAVGRSLLLGLGTLAAALQIFSFPLVAGTTSAPFTQVPLGQVVSGVGSSWSGDNYAASVVLLLLVGLLGLAATIVVVLTGLWVEVVPRGGSGVNPPRPAVSRPVALGITAVATVLVLLITASGLRPWLARADRAVGASDAGQVLTSTWIPPLITTAVGVLLALLAAFAIGSLRPWGRRSELLLLPFAPFLFVGTGVLYLDRLVERGPPPADPSLLSLLPPTWIAVPALVVFTVAVRGQTLRHRPTRPGEYARRVILPVLPLVAVVAGAMWVVQAQDLLWGILTGRPDAGLVSAPAALYEAWRFRDSGPAFGLPLPLAAIAVLAIVFGLFQVLYLDRLAIRIAGPAKAERR